MNTIFDSFTDRPSILANKQGMLTEVQRDLLHLTSGLTFWYAFGSVAVITAIVAWATTTQMANLPANVPPIPEYYWIVLAIAIGSPIVYLGWQIARSSRVAREIASGNIPSEEGRVEWTGRHYCVAASVNGLRSIYGRINLMPGRYRFYLLPGSRYLLSADPLDVPQTSCAALTHILGRVLQFTKDDLAANREGHISPAQATRLRSRAIQAGLLATVFLAVFVGAFILAFTYRSTWYFVFFGIWFLISLLVLPPVIRYSTDRLRERHGELAFLQGQGTKGFHYLTRSVIWSYLVNHERFDVSKRAYNAMVEGEVYRIYYTPLRKTILSVEAIPPNSTL